MQTGKLNSELLFDKTDINDLMRYSNYKKQLSHLNDEKIPENYLETIPEKYITDELCIDFINKYLRDMHKETVYYEPHWIFKPFLSKTIKEKNSNAKELHKKYIETCQIILSKIPEKFRTKNVCKCAIHFSIENFRYVPEKYLNEEFIRVLFKGDDISEYISLIKTNKQKM